MARFAVCMFEDSGYRGFLPLSCSRAVFELRCGIVPLWEKTVREYGGLEDVEFSCVIRPYLAEILGERLEFSVNGLEEFSGENVLFINGRLLAPAALAQLLPLEGRPASFLSDGELIAFRVDQAAVRRKYCDPELFLGAGFSEAVAGELPATEVKAILLKYPWDLVSNNPAQIGVDFENLRHGGKIEGEVDERAVICNARAVTVSPGARVEAGVVIDARGGPVFVGTGARILSPSRIEGPCAVGENTVMVGGRVTEGSSFGPWCRIGGEVEQSIFHGYTNKYHEGFIGHSYVGEWVNLGALTTNSDLKNTYGQVTAIVDGKRVETGALKVGTCVGDLTRTGIGTLLDTGSAFGFSVNVFGGKGILPKYVPSYLWGDGESFSEYVLERAVETARVVMERRGVQMSPVFERMMREIFEMTAEERRHFLRA
ncbi:MAG: putative sugar nucleotidyl transferase [Candidatus Eisenbacteria bacterium]